MDTYHSEPALGLESFATFLSVPLPNVSRVQRGLNTKRPTIVCFLVPTKPLPHHMDRQARTSDTVLVKSGEMTGIEAEHCLGRWGRGKDDRKQNTSAKLGEGPRELKWSKRKLVEG